MTPAESIRLIIRGLEGLLQFYKEQEQGRKSQGHDRRLSRRELALRFGMSRSTLCRRIALGKFPEPDFVDGQIQRWTEATVTTWEAEHQRPGRDSGP